MSQDKVSTRRRSAEAEIKERESGTEDRVDTVAAMLNAVALAFGFDNIITIESGFDTVGIVLCIPQIAPDIEESLSDVYELNTMSLEAERVKLM
jgi:hypothetical protein